MLRNRIALWTVFLVALSWGAMAQSQEPHPQTPQVKTNQQPDGAAKSNAQGEKETKPAAQMPAEIQKVQAKDAERHTDRDAEKRADEAREYWPFHVFGARLKITDSLLALFTFLLIVVQVFFLYRTDQATHKAANAANKSAEAAMLGQRSFHSNYPNWETDRDPKQPGPPLQYKFANRMDNVGNTAASNMRNHIGFVLLPGEMPDDFKFSDDAKPLAQTGLLGPKQWLLGPHVPPDRFITAGEMLQIQQGKLKLYVFGWVKYFDGFPGTPERITKFCYSIRVTGNPEMPIVFTPHSRHNCADEGCNEN
jgi:hypothetical protein